MIENGNFEEFEQYLQDEVNELKMFPSDHVWNNISKQIQPKKPWPALTLITIFIVGSLSIATFLNYPPDNVLYKLKVNTSNTTNTITQSKTTFTFSDPNTILNNLTEKKLSAKIWINKTSVDVFNSSKLISKNLQKELVDNSTDINENKESFTRIEPYYYPIVSSNLNQEVINSFTSSLKAPALKTPKDIVSSQDEELNYNSNLARNSSKKRSNKTPLTDRWAYEIYTTPSNSYRKLEDDQLVNQISAQTSSVNSINRQVKQKSALGYELGLGVKYKLSENFAFNTGIQFNLRQYYIDAFQSSGLATIQVVQNNKLQTFDVNSGFSNGSGLVETRLDNRLYQVSIPIGLEYILINKKHWGLDILGSLQPTYSLNKNAYIISTDYKYYANGEPFFRTWNINSAINTNLIFKLKNSSIFVGPQLRYQHLPTYNDKYPIKEYRMDYGIKIGIRKSFK